MPLVDTPLTTSCALCPPSEAFDDRLAHLPALVSSAARQAGVSNSSARASAASALDDKVRVSAERCGSAASSSFVVVVVVVVVVVGVVVVEAVA